MAERFPPQVAAPGVPVAVLFTPFLGCLRTSSDVAAWFVSAAPRARGEPLLVHLRSLPSTSELPSTEQAFDIKYDTKIKSAFKCQEMRLNYAFSYVKLAFKH